MDENQEFEQRNENFRAFYLLQYDRIDKLESKRESFSNLTITITIGILAFIFSKEFQPTNVQKGLFGFIVILINWMSIKFIKESHYFVKMHQGRAKKALKRNAPELRKIIKKVGKKDSSKSLFSRNNLYMGMHYLFLIFGILILLSGIFFVIARTQNYQV